MGVAAGATGDELRSEVEALDWYHTLELAPGIVTPGWFDTRGVVERLPFPASLSGSRCLDVGTFDGFWAFEMERRGADEVVAIDVLNQSDWDWPVGSAPEVVAEVGRRKSYGAGFEIASRALGSSVQRVEVSIYDLDDELGRFDFAYLGSLLLHLRDPVRALERLAAVCDGTALIVDAIDPLLTFLAPRRALATLDGRGRPWWWRPNPAGLIRMVEAAGFELLRPLQRLRMPPGEGQPRAPLTPRTLRSRAGRESLLASRWGDPHAALLAAPRRA